MHTQATAGRATPSLPVSKPDNSFTILWMHIFPRQSDSIAAGPFADWLSRARASLRGDAGADVPCGDCTGCCTSGYSVQLRPEDQRARALIPDAWVVRPPGFPSGHLTVPARPDGTCPMLSAGQCSIYAARPQTCRDYDCRVFTAAGIDAGGPDKAVINKRVRQWQFDYPSEADQLAHRAVAATASFIRNHAASFAVRVPTSPMGIAVFAIKAYAVFLDLNIEHKPHKEIAAAILKACKEFDAAEPACHRADAPMCGTL